MTNGTRSRILFILLSPAMNTTITTATERGIDRGHRSTSRRRLHSTGLCKPQTETDNDKAKNPSPCTAASRGVEPSLEISAGLSIQGWV